MGQKIYGTIITRDGKRYFTKSDIRSGDKHVYARRIIKTGLSKKVVRVWLKRSRLQFGEFVPKGKSKQSRF